MPDEWLQGLNIKKMVTSSIYDNKINKYKVNCGGDLHMWESSGWIMDSDPYGINDDSINDNNNHIIIGWFQWYCRFFQGRRCSDDARQISRGNAVMGPKGRWRNNLINKIITSSPKNLQIGLDNHSISPVVRQLLQHWGYVLKLKDLEAAANR